MRKSSAASATRNALAGVHHAAARKSTLAERVVSHLNTAQSGMAVVLPMDGFHYDDAVLRELDRHQRKGAIDTFDAGGFVHAVRRLKANTEDAIAVPVFDRSIEIARAGGRLIPRSTGIIVAEGNYLLVRRRLGPSCRAFSM